MGQAVYGHKGFTIDVKNHQELKEALNTIMCGEEKLNEEQQEKLNTFLYHMLFEYLYPCDPFQHPDKLDRLISLLKQPSENSAKQYFNTLGYF